MVVSCWVWFVYPHKGDQKLVKTVRSSTQDWSSFQLAITTHQQSFTHNGIARGAKMVDDGGMGNIYIEQEGDYVPDVVCINQPGFHRNKLKSMHPSYVRVQ